MLDEMTLTLSGDTMTITVNDDTIITIDGADATLDDLQVGDTVSFFLDGEVVTSLSVGMPEPTQSKQSMQDPGTKVSCRISMVPRSLPFLPETGEWSLSARSLQHRHNR